MLAGCRPTAEPPPGASALPKPAPKSALETPAPFENLIILMIDTLRADHLPCYGYERNTAPFVCRLAEDGLSFESYSASSWTRPSVATLLTGQPPPVHQTITRSDSLPAAIPYLPELLSEQGFVTATFVGNLNSGRRFGFARGFEHYHQTRPTGKVDGAKVTDRGISLLPMLSGRYFLYLHYVDPHDPYRPARPWQSAGREAREHSWTQPRKIGSRPPNPREITSLIDQYDGEIREMDSEIERFLAAADAAGLLADTLVVITSDHGEEFGEHGGLTHGRTLWEEVVAVPLVLWSADGRLRPSAGRPVLDHIDVLPTLLEALALEVPQGLAGDSRWSNLEAPRTGSRWLHLDLDDRALLASRNGDQKTIWSPQRSLTFDLASDREEQAPRPAKRQATLHILEHYLAIVTSTPPQQAPLDDEAQAALTALGYLDPTEDTTDLGRRQLTRESIERALDQLP